MRINTPSIRRIENASNKIIFFQVSIRCPISKWETGSLLIFVDIKTIAVVYWLYWYVVYTSGKLTVGRFDLSNPSFCPAYRAAQRAFRNCTTTLSRAVME